MRFDGHVKITQQALHILVDMSKRKDVIWPSPVSSVSDKSSALGHWLGVLDYLNSPHAGLPELVAGVSDITTIQSHFKQTLQRIHFMRATEETELTAYQNCVNFIVNEMDAWILARTESFWQQWSRSMKRMNTGPVIEKGMRVDAHLAKALHCLQDSFSPGHVLRSENDGNVSLGTTKNNAAPACFGSAPPIRRIFDYNHPHGDEDVQAKQLHDDSDYYAGSLAYAAANAASYASADLLQIGLNAIANKRSDPGDWKKLISRWLTHRLVATAGKPKNCTNTEALLQRSCSPAKLTCGRQTAGH